jgi:hypothetical protein
MKGVITRSFLWRYKYLFLFGLGAALSLPLFTYAQSVGASGLVPCGAVSSTNYFNPMYYLSATSCNFCYLAKLIQNVVNFLVMVTIPISVAMFAWAGIMFFTATGNPKKIARAKSIFSAVFIGFIITISGWLVIQVVLQTITNNSFYNANHWADLDCSEYNQFRNRTATIDQILTPVSTANNPTQYPYPTTPGTTPPTTGGTPGTPTDVGSSCLSTNGTCTDSQAQSALAIYNVENRSNPVNSAPGVNYQGVNSSLVQTIVNTAASASAGEVLVTSAERPGSVTVNGTPSEHAMGLAVDIGGTNNQLNTFIAQNYTPVGQNWVASGQPAYKDAQGYIWSWEPATTAGSTGNHWHVSKDGH